MSCSRQQLNKPCEDSTCLRNKKPVLLYVCFVRAWRQLPWHPYHAATCDRRDNFAWSLAHEQITNHKLFFFSLRPHNGSQRTDSLILYDGHLESWCMSVRACTLTCVCVQERRNVGRYAHHELALHASQQHLLTSLHAPPVCLELVPGRAD